MPLVDYNDTGSFVGYMQEKPEPAPRPGISEYVPAAFRMENDVMAAADMLTRKSDYPKDPLYDIGKKLRGWDAANRTNLWDNYRDNFLGVQSDEEFLSILGRINQEQKDKETVANAGFGGIVASIAAGVASPTMLMPFIGQERGLAAVAKGAVMGGLAGAAQEIPLQLAQETRTGGESAFAISAATILGGVLGGAVAALRPGELDKMVRQLDIEGDMVRSTIDAPIPGSLSAGAVPGIGAGYAGKLQAAKAAKLADWLGPVTRVINQSEDRTASWFMSQLSDAGLRLEGNSAGINTATTGGTVEALVKPYYGQFAVVTENLDQGYAKYIFGDGQVPGLFPNQRASLTGMWDNEKLSKTEFKAEIAKALWSGDKHVIPEVQAIAQDIRTKILDPMLKQAQETGVLGDVKIVGDSSFYSRMYRNDIIAAKQNEFIDILAKDYAEKLNGDFGEQLARLDETQRRNSQLVEDLVRPKEEVDALRTQLAEQMKALDEGRGKDLVDLEDEIAKQRSLARLATKAGDREARDAALKQARELERSAGDDLKSVRAQRAEIRRRQQGLARAASVLEERQMKKLTAIEKIEDVNTRQLGQVARAGQRILNKLDTVSDAALEKELKSLGIQFDDLREALEKGDDRIARMLEGEQPDTVKLLAAEDLQRTRTGKLSDIARDMETIDTIDRASVRAAITEALDEVQQRALNQIEKRLARENKLIESAAALDPAQVGRRIDAIKGLSKERKLEFLENMRLRGADSIDLNSRTADFTAYARERAEETTRGILGSPVRLPLNDLIQGARGPELARVLDISTDKIKDFIETDVEKMLRGYLRTMAPDIEMARKFGSVNGQPVFDQMEQEYSKRLAALKESGLEGKALEKQQKKLKEDYDDNLRDLGAVIGRLRGTWGLPDNPNGMAYRMGRAVLNLNVLRLMGGTLIASIPDAARPIQRYGLTRTFRDGFVPMITNWQQLKMSAREAKLAGAALDSIMHTRAQSINDVLDDYGRHTKFEKGLEYATNQLGVMALFDQWTVAMKQLSSSIIIGKITDSLDIVYGGAKASAKEAKEAQAFLASKSLAGPEGEKIWAELNKPGGANRVNDVLLPNTESWTDLDAQRAFRGALATEINNTIITPGVEKPLWMDASMTGRLIGQFKSFGMSSTYKVLLSGVQQRDMAFFNGTLVSLALGALSYYLSGVSAGGDTYDKMMKAGAGKFADEAINRSGVLGIFSDVQRFFERIPATQPYVSFSGERTTRRGGDDLVDVILGPTMGLAKTGAKAIAGMDDPTKSTVHNVRQMLPWQNVILWRRIMDEIEKAAGSNLPEKRN